MEKKERNIGLGVVVILVIVGILVIRATLTGSPTNKNVSNENTEMYSNSLSGIVIINGYIPEGSKVKIMYRPASGGNYMLNTQQPTAKSSVAFTISGLVENTKYKVYSNLVDVDGKEIGESLVITAKAPNGNLQMTLDSTAIVE